MKRNAKYRNPRKRTGIPATFGLAPGCYAIRHLFHTRPHAAYVEPRHYYRALARGTFKLGKPLIVISDADEGFDMPMRVPDRDMPDAVARRLAKCQRRASARATPERKHERQARVQKRLAAKGR